MSIEQIHPTSCTVHNLDIIDTFETSIVNLIRMLSTDEKDLEKNFLDLFSTSNDPAVIEKNAKAFFFTAIFGKSATVEGAFGTVLFSLFYMMNKQLGLPLPIALKMDRSEMEELLDGNAVWISHLEGEFKRLCYLEQFEQVLHLAKEHLNPVQKIYFSLNVIALFVMYGVKISEQKNVTLKEEAEASLMGINVFLKFYKAMSVEEKEYLFDLISNIFKQAEIPMGDITLKLSAIEQIPSIYQFLYLTRLSVSDKEQLAPQARVLTWEQVELIQDLKMKINWSKFYKTQMEVATHFGDIEMVQALLQKVDFKEIVGALFSVQQRLAHLHTTDPKKAIQIRDLVVGYITKNKQELTAAYGRPFAVEELLNQLKELFK